MEISSKLRFILEEDLESLKEVICWVLRSVGNIVWPTFRVFPLPSFGLL